MTDHKENPIYLPFTVTINKHTHPHIPCYFLHNRRHMQHPSIFVLRNDASIQALEHYCQENSIDRPVFDIREHRGVYFTMVSVNFPCGLKIEQHSRATTQHTSKQLAAAAICQDILSKFHPNYKFPSQFLTQIESNP